MDLPRTFFETILFMPISLSQNPPNQGALLGMNFHFTSLLAKLFISEGEENRAVNSSAADKNVETLSESTTHGKEHLPLKRLKANKKETLSSEICHNLKMYCPTNGARK